METNTRIANITSQALYLDDKWVTPRSKSRSKRRKLRRMGKLLAPKKPPMQFSRHWAATEIKRVWRGYISRTKGVKCLYKLTT